MDGGSSLVQDVTAKLLPQRFSFLGVCFVNPNGSECCRVSTARMERGKESTDRGLAAEHRCLLMLSCFIGILFWVSYGLGALCRAESREIPSAALGKDALTPAPSPAPFWG